MEKNLKLTGILSLVTVLLMILTSCSSNKSIAYFQSITDSISSSQLPTFVEPRIKPDDILSITIQTIDPTTSAVVTQVTPTAAIGASTSGNTGTQMVTGFLVDNEGTIELPLLGKIKVLGATTAEAREIIRKAAAVYYKDPAVQVRFANYKITVIGEVVKPGTYLLANEKVSILDALGLAGDLTIFGRRENVLLIRDNGSAKKFVRLNLNNAEIFKSPYYYLKQNDVIYVEPNRNKLADSDASILRYVTIAVSLITTAVLIVTKIH